MAISRRHFLHGALAGSASLITSRKLSASRQDLPASSAQKPEGQSRGKLLVLGGTRFLGPHLVEEALARGWEVTLFNRGKSNPKLFPDLEKLVGDRDGGLEALEGREWDAVIDTSGYIPRLVKDSASLLADKVKQYLFISTMSVYAEDDAGSPQDENSPVATIEDETVEEVTNETYGALQALCEQAAEAAMPGRVSNIRPGLIVGPLDNSGRFTYWPWRIANGGEVLAPGNPDARVEFIDARDLAAFCIHCLEEKVVGVYNANGPAAHTSMAELLYGCKIVLGADAQFTWISDEKLLEWGAGPWIELPLWIPSDYPRGAAVVDKALAAGMILRPAGDTIRDTAAWAFTALDNRRTLGNSLKPEKEADLLLKWKESQN